MKKIIIIIILLIFIPFFIATLYNKNYREIKLEYISNINIRVLRNKTGEIEVMPIDVYLVGVLAGEMPIYFDMEALKAQAVASRSYALKRIGYNKDKDYDVEDSIMNQVYLDNEYLKEAWKDKYIKNINKIRKAVNSTLDEYLYYEDTLVDAMFFSTSNGYTEDPENIFGFSAPYLKSVASPWDEGVSEAFMTSKIMSLRDFYNLLGLEYNKNLNIEILKRSSSNRILLLKINGKEFSGNVVKQKLSLRSNDFEITLLGNDISITSKGYGHGVGMSQYGALGMAKEGYKYDEILKYYYNDSYIKKIKL